MENVAFNRGHTISALSLQIFSSLFLLAQSLICQSLPPGLCHFMYAHIHHLFLLVLFFISLSVSTSCFFPSSLGGRQPSHLGHRLVRRFIQCLFAQNKRSPADPAEVVPLCQIRLTSDLVPCRSERAAVSAVQVVLGE